MVTVTCERKMTTPTGGERDSHLTRWTSRSRGGTSEPAECSSRLICKDTVRIEAQNGNSLPYNARLDSGKVELDGTEDTVVTGHYRLGEIDLRVEAEN